MRLELLSGLEYWARVELDLLKKAVEPNEFGLCTTGPNLSPAFELEPKPVPALDKIMNVPIDSVLSFAFFIYSVF